MTQYIMCHDNINIAPFTMPVVDHILAQGGHIGHVSVSDGCPIHDLPICRVLIHHTVNVNAEMAAKFSVKLLQNSV